MKKFTTLLLCAAFVPVANSQFNLDYGIKAGGANYLGEIGGAEKTRRDFVWDMKLNQTSFSVGSFIRYQFNPNIAGSAHLTYGRIKGDDALSENRGRRGRNLSFRNDIIDLSVRGEVIVLKAFDIAPGQPGRTDFAAYFFGGASVYHHNPKARNADYNGGEWTELQPLNTQGLAEKYSLWGVSVPLGVGAYVTHRRFHRFGWELGWHTTFTDHLDDAGSEHYPDMASVDPMVFDAFTDRSDEVDPADLPAGGVDNYGGTEDQRANPAFNDAYLFTTLSYSRVIRTFSTWYRQHYGRFAVRRPFKYRVPRVKF